MVKYNLDIIKPFFCLTINNFLGFDSDEDVFSSAPSSPCSEYSSSDESNVFYNAERDFSYLLFSK